MDSEYGSCESELEDVHWTPLHMAHDVDELRPDWSEGSSLDDDSYDSAKEAAENWCQFRDLQKCWFGEFFQVLGEEWEVGRKIAEGGQAEIFEAEQTLPDGNKEKWVLKRFKRGIELRHIRMMFPAGMLGNLGPNGRYSNNHCCSMYGLMILQDGRFGILMKRYWGDLRKLIDLSKFLNNHQDFPFPDLSIVVQIMLDIALGMQALHEDGIVHGDLKASNVFILPLEDDHDPIHGGKFSCHVADFETSVGFRGTGFWRAPEILDALMGTSGIEISEKSDVYSFAMTCYEILTGRMPFEGLLENTRAGRYEVVHNHMRPNLPESIDLWIKELLDMCWHQDPSQRPSFKDILIILQIKLREGREPDILAPRSSTWEELNDPRVRRNRYQIMEVPQKFPILIEMLKSTLQCCEKSLKK